MTVIRGIDISHHQGSPDFRRVKSAGIRFVMLKATEGVDYVDPCFHANIRAAAAAGIPVGAYHFLRATPLEQQVTDFLAAIKPYKVACLAIDVENPTKNGKVIPEVSNLGKAGITDRIIAIYQAIRAAGYTCPVYVYSNPSWFGTYVDKARCQAAGLKIWLAWWTSATPENTDRSSICDIWQYGKGTVDGISGPVDVDVAYHDFAAPTWSCDTSGTVEVARGAAYQALITCRGRPQVVAGTPDVVTVLHRYDDGDKHYYYFVPIARPGDAVGIYINGGPRQFVIKVK